MTLRFRSRIEINKINPYVLVRADQASQLKRNWRRPMPVCVRVNGKPDTAWRINLMPVGDGNFFLYLHELVRNASSTRVGDVVSITLEFDDEYKGGPAHPMPSWFGDELDRNPDARKGWVSLSPRASCAWAESERDSRIGEILIQPAGWAEASRRWQSRIRKICATG
jgi:hypothetical protein